MRRIQGALAAAALVLGFGVATAVPASAASETTLADSPAVVSCSFGELYHDQGLTDFYQYIPRDTELTVTGGSNQAWQVTVHNNSRQTGWMSGECVRFLA